MNKINSEDRTNYYANTPNDNTKKNLMKKQKEINIINEAITILTARIKTKDIISSPQDIKNFLRLKMDKLEHEVFCIIALNNRHHVLDFTELFKGTINGAAVYPREVVKYAIHHNACAVIFAHNHPSGIPEPSQSDKTLTKRLIDALALIEVRVLDHIIIGEGDPVSFAERGLM